MLTFCKINLVRNIQCNQTTLTQHLNQACNYSREKIHLWNDLDFFSKTGFPEHFRIKWEQEFRVTEKNFAGMYPELFFFFY